MNIDSALQYPFKSLAKVLTIVLIFTTAFTFFLAMLFNSFDFMAYMEGLAYYIDYDYMPDMPEPSALFFPSIIGLIGTMIVQGFWISGYGISVIRHIMEGYEKLPAFQFNKNIVDGLALFFASLWYAVAALPVLFIFLILVGMMGSNDSTSGLAVLTFCSGIIMAIPMIFLLGWSYFIGMVRCAFENDRSALFQIPTNLGIARRNVKTSFTLTGFQILLAIIFGFASQGINWVLDIISDIVFGNSLDSNMFLTVVVISLIITFTINIIQQFSSLHLLAQYGHNLGFMVGYEDEFDDFI